MNAEIIQVSSNVIVPCSFPYCDPGLTQNRGIFVSVCYGVTVDDRMLCGMGEGQSMMHNYGQRVVGICINSVGGRE